MASLWRNARQLGMRCWSAGSTSTAATYRVSAQQICSRSPAVLLLQIPSVSVRHNWMGLGFATSVSRTALSRGLTAQPIASRVGQSGISSQIEAGVRSFFQSSVLLRAHIVPKKPYKMKTHSGCKQRFKITKWGLVKYHSPGRTHLNHGTPGRKQLAKKKPRYLNATFGKKIKMMMNCARNKKPAWPKRKPLVLKAKMAKMEEAGTSA